LRRDPDVIGREVADLAPRLVAARGPHVSVHEATIDLALADVELRIGRSTVSITRHASDPYRVDLEINDGERRQSVTLHVRS
jgi:hypothetical protein